MITLPLADDTRRLGAQLGAIVRAGDLIVLDGPLGAGKTVLVQGLALGLGAKGAVTSPTFVISRVHEGDGCRSFTSTPTASPALLRSTTWTSTPISPRRW